MPGPLSVHQLTRDSVLGPDPLSPCDALPDGRSVATALDMAVGETQADGIDKVSGWCDVSVKLCRSLFSAMNERWPLPLWAFTDEDPRMDFVAKRSFVRAGNSGID
jgi:hypothetical protein